MSMTNLNDKWTEEDYDKYFDEMNLNKRERVKNNSRSRNQKDREQNDIKLDDIEWEYERTTRQRGPRDWYKRKVSKEMQKLSMKFVIVKDLQQDKNQLADMKD